MVSITPRTRAHAHMPRFTFFPCCRARRYFDCPEFGTMPFMKMSCQPIRGPPGTGRYLSLTEAHTTRHTSNVDTNLGVFVQVPAVGYRVLWVYLCWFFLFWRSCGARLAFTNSPSEPPSFDIIGLQRAKDLSLSKRDGLKYVGQHERCFASRVFAPFVCSLFCAVCRPDTVAMLDAADGLSPYFSTNTITGGVRQYGCV